MDARGNFQPARQPFDELRLARAQIARQRDDKSASRRVAEFFPERFRFRRTMRNERSPAR